MLRLYDKILGFVFTLLVDSLRSIRPHRGYIHSKVRFKERYGLKYSKSLETKFLQQIRGKNGGKYFISKDVVCSGSLFRLKYKQKYVYAVYRNKRMVTFLSKEMVNE